MYQRIIEDVYWRHRIWPKDNHNPKPALDAAISQAELEKKVQDYMRDSEALEDRHRPITAVQLQTEMDRMAQHTKQPEVLRELFEALENDPFVIAECLARPVLSERLLGNWRGEPDRDLSQRTEMRLDTVTLLNNGYSLPTIAAGTNGCTDDTWTATAIAPFRRDSHTAVWTGTEMIVWGGTDGFIGTPDPVTGGRYDPSSDSWTATSTTNVPLARYSHTAVWTGTEMIVWGGINDDGPFIIVFNDGGNTIPPRTAGQLPPLTTRRQRDRVTQQPGVAAK